MKTLILLLTIISLFLFSCQATKTNTSANTLEGTWQLNYITGPRIAFDGLYPNKKPTITFDLKENRVSGNNSCNHYFGALKVANNKINFIDSKMGMTMMICQGEGEKVYMKTLEKIDSYSISEDGKTLNFIMGDNAMLRFEKQLVDSHNSQNSLDWQGTYKGFTPCADCEGIETELVLNKKLTYLIKTKYLGEKESNVFEESGNFVWDETGGSVILLGLKGKPFQYKVGENKLIQLDTNGKVILGTLAEKYVLEKQ